MEFDKSRVFLAVNADELKVGRIEMNTTEQIFNVGNKKCEKNCPVHGLVTHNSCMFCDALITERIITILKIVLLAIVCGIGLLALISGIAVALG